MAYYQEWNKTEPLDWKAVAACILGGIALWPLTSLLPVLGWDWFSYFYPRHFEGTYPPWAYDVMVPFVALSWRASLALINSLMFMAVAVATAREGRRYSLSSRLSAVIMAITSSPLLMLLWQGNVDGLVLFGLVAFPPGVALVLMKPTIAGWAVLARKRWTLWAIGFLVLTFFVWGLWPFNMINSFQYRYLHPMAMGWHNLGWPVALLGLVLLLFTNADPLRLMAAGSFLAPYVMPVHYLVLIPALGRVNGWKRWILWGWAWVLWLVPGFSGITRYVALGFPLAVWWLLREEGSHVWIDGINKPSYISKKTRNRIHSIGSWLF